MPSIYGSLCQTSCFDPNHKIAFLKTCSLICYLQIYVSKQQMEKDTCIVCFALSSSNCTSVFFSTSFSFFGWTELSVLDVAAAVVVLFIFLLTGYLGKLKKNPVKSHFGIQEKYLHTYYDNAGRALAWWLSLGLWIQKSGVRAPLVSNRVVALSKAHLLPKKYW